MNPHPFRSLRPVPATHSDARLAPVTGRVEAHALAGHLVSSPPSAQPDVPSDSPRNEPIRMLRLTQVATMTGLSKAKVYELQKRGDFPQRVQLTAGRVAWVEAEVQAWLAARIAANRTRSLRLFLGRLSSIPATGLSVRFNNRSRMPQLIIFRSTAIVVRAASMPPRARDFP